MLLVSLVVLMFHSLHWHICPPGALLCLPAHPLVSSPAWPTPSPGPPSHLAPSFASPPLAHPSHSPLWSARPFGPLIPPAHPLTWSPHSPGSRTPLAHSITWRPRSPCSVISLACSLTRHLTHLSAHLARSPHLMYSLIWYTPSQRHSPRRTRVLTFCVLYGWLVPGLYGWLVPGSVWHVGSLLVDLVCYSGSSLAPTQCGS
jgi:hypothetical protein